MEFVREIITNPRYTIIAGVVGLGFLALIILYIVGLVYLFGVAFNDKKFEDHTTTQKNIMKLSVVLTVFLLLFFIVSLVLWIYGKSNVFILAKSLLKETDKMVYDSKCETLFKNDPGLFEQYKSMKSSRPIEEVRNLCGNYAKNLLKLK